MRSSMVQQIIRGCSSKRCSQMQNKILYTKGCRPSGRRLSASPEVNAPEHLEINLADNERVIERLHNYGSLFIGGNTAEVFGDYASGTNHTLPTVKAARYTGGVYVGTFLKTCTHQSMTDEASHLIAPLVNRMAHGEGLEGHAFAAECRF